MFLGDKQALYSTNFDLETGVSSLCSWVIEPANAYGAGFYLCEGFPSWEKTCYKNTSFQPNLLASYLAFLRLRFQLLARPNIRTVCVTLCQYGSVSGDVTAMTGLALE